MSVRNHAPVYVSKAAPKSLWQEYRVYPDRVELKVWIALKTLVIPAGDIVEVEVRPPLVIADLFRGKSLASALSLKIDWADLCPHVAMHKKSGWIRHVRFTPDHPEAFVAACRSLRQDQ